MPHPYELFICYDGLNLDDDYCKMLKRVAGKDINIIGKKPRQTQYSLLNRALEEASGDFFIHLENDFYWVNPQCLTAALSAFRKWGDIDYIRFEVLPFTIHDFKKYEQVDGRDILWMKDTTPYKFTLNPHIRREKYPCGGPFMENGFTKHDEQHFNDLYVGTSCCMTGDNFRHLGIFDECGHYKEHYVDRFTGRRRTTDFNPLVEFMKITDDITYLNLFRKYLDDNGFKCST